MSLKKIYSILFALLFLAYPALVYFGTLHFSPRIVSLTIILCLILRLFSSSRNRLAKIVLPATLVGLSLCVVSALLDNEVYMQYLPVIYSVLFFLAFGSTLLRPPSIERGLLLQNNNIYMGIIFCCKRIDFSHYCILCHVQILGIL